MTNRYDVFVGVRVTVEAEDGRGAFDRAHLLFLTEHGSDNLTASTVAPARADAPLSAVPEWADDEPTGETE